MKRPTLMAGVLALGLASCAQNNNGLDIGQGFGMDANLAGADVSVAVIEVRSKASGALIGYRSTYTLTNPTITFNARPQSVGLQLQKATVEVLDNAGTRYDNDLGIYQRSASFVVKPGLVCSIAGTSIDACGPNNKIPSNVATVIGTAELKLVTDEIAATVAGDCQSVGCPTLKLKVTFAGIDDAGRPQTVVVAGAMLGAHVTSRTVVQE